MKILGIIIGFLLSFLFLISGLPSFFTGSLVLSFLLGITALRERNRDKSFGNTEQAKKSLQFAEALFSYSISLVFIWLATTIWLPKYTPQAWFEKEEARVQQERKAEKERLEKLSLLAPDFVKDFDQAGVTVTVMSDLELAVGRLYVFRGQRSDDKTERLVFYEMPDSRCILETSRVPKRGDKLPLMIRTFRATYAWYAPLGQYPVATIYFVKNNCI